MTAVWPVHLCWFAIWNPKQKRKLFSSLQHSFWSFSSTQQLVFRKRMRSYELWVDCHFWLKLGNRFKNYWGHGKGEDTGRHMDRLADRWTDSVVFLGSQAKDSCGSVACLFQHIVTSHGAFLSATRITVNTFKQITGRCQLSLALGEIKTSRAWHLPLPSCSSLHLLKLISSLSAQGRRKSGSASLCKCPWGGREGCLWCSCP